MPPLFWAGILLTKVICAALVDALHGGREVHDLDGLLRSGARARAPCSTDIAATPSQPRTATAKPRRALRRIRPVAIFCSTSTSTSLPYWGVTPVTLHQR